MIQETKHGLRNLTNFDGRDGRQTFWLYVVALVILNFALGMVASVPMLANMFGSAMHSAQSGASPEQMQVTMLAAMGPALKTQVIVGAVLALITSLLFVAAFVRRLHDSNKTGWIALIPLMTTVYAHVFTFSHVDEMIGIMQAAMAANDPQAVMEMQRTMQAYSAVGWLGYLVVIVFGVLQGTHGPNKYGAEPGPLD